MADNRIEKLADMLVNYSIAVKPGDKVVIQAGTIAEPLMRELYKKTVQAGGHPFTMLSVPGTDDIFYRYASDEQLKFIPEPLKLIYETYDCRIAILSDENTKELSGIDPKKTVMRAKSRTGLMNTMMQRSATGEFRWVVAPYPTNAYAQDAEMSLSDYEDFVFRACMPDQTDPIGYWKKVGEYQTKITDWLKTKKLVRVTGKDTDLTLSIAGRTFISCHGLMNVPDGEIFTGPIEDSVEGHVHFSYPAIYNGREVTGVKLWFEKGKVVKAEADKNEDFLLKTIDTDEGARYVGEFAIGTNEGITKFTREILFDEKIGGSFHMALGAGYPETGSKNVSAIHWDMVCDLRDGGKISVDGETLYQNGKFVKEF